MENELQLDYTIVDTSDGEDAQAPEPQEVEVEEEIDNQDNPDEGEPGEADGDGVEEEVDPDAADDEEVEKPAKKSVKLDPEAQKILDAEIAKRVKAQREAERRAQELERRLAQIEEANRPTRPEVPELPDPYQVTEQEYQAAIQAREKALQDAAIFDLRQQELERQRQALLQQEIERKRNEMLEQRTKYFERAKASGLDPVVLEGAGAVVGSEMPWVQEFVLGDKYGPQMVQYLAANPSEREKLNSMNAEQRAYYLGTTVRNKAAATVKPKVSGAPAPVSKPNRAATAESLGPPGAKYF